MARKTKGMTKGYKGGQSSGASKPSEKPKRLPLTHFLCIPLVTASSRPQLEASLKHFQETVANETSDGRQLNSSKEVTHETSTTPLFPPKAVRPVGTIHFTLGVMSLESEERVEEAVNYLRSLDLKRLVEANFGIEPSPAGLESVQSTVPMEAEPSSISEELPSQGQTARKRFAAEASSNSEESLSISLASLHSMHSPKNTSILYAAPHDLTERLLPICTTLRALFEKEGYLIEDDRPLKLHATIVNTIYAKTGNRGGGSLRFDAEPLLEQWKDFIWATDFTLEKLAICKMGAQKITAESGQIMGEEYEEVASIPFTI